MARIKDLDPATYVRHAVHQGDRIWAETNCYTDVVLELLWGLGHEPLAAMGFALSIDWDVDQWTFFKFRHADIETLYGLGIHELAPWKPLAVHVEDQVAAGRPVLVELDSYFLPDTAGTAYGLAHVKSTVAVNEIDTEAQTMGYFHNQGYHRLAGEDFRLIFQTEGLVHERMLPPYIEFVKALPGRAPLQGEALVEASVASLRAHLDQVPAHNPVDGFKAALARDMDWLLASDLETFHAYSFATLRQLGACLELGASYLEWLDGHGLDGLTTPREDLLAISSSAKTLQLKLARSVMRKRPLDLAPLDDMATRWQAAIDGLRGRFG